MSPVYRNEKSFQDSLQSVLKDKTAQALERMHLKASRRDAVFHYLPDRFAEAIAKTPMTECVFASILGEQKGSIHYIFADLIAAEIGVGARIDNSVTVNDMMEKTLNLVKQFIEHSANFIADELNGWGFEVLPVFTRPRKIHHRGRGHDAREPNRLSIRRKSERPRDGTES